MYVAELMSRVRCRVVQRSIYKTIDEVAGRVFEHYSIPFRLCAALELKLRSITGGKRV